MDTKIGTGQTGGYDQIPSFEDFKVDYGLKLGEDLDRGIASEGMNLDIQHLQTVYLAYYRIRSLIEIAKQQGLTSDEFLNQCDWFVQARKSNRDQLEQVKTTGNSAEILRLQSIESFYQILGNDVYVTSLYLEEQEIRSKKKGK